MSEVIATAGGVPVVGRRGACGSAEPAEDLATGGPGHSGGTRPAAPGRRGLRAGPRITPAKQVARPVAAKPQATAVVKPVATVVAKPKIGPLPDVDQTDTTGWMLCDRSALPSKHVGPDGLNPHGTGGDLIVYEKPLDDFLLDLDYKLTRDGNTGVFLRVGDLRDPVKTGLEVPLSDTTRTGVTDSGAVFGLVAPRVNAQKPAGQWNHLTIRAQGENIAVALNGKAVSEIHLDEWSVAGQRPDGTPITAPPLAESSSATCRVPDMSASGTGAPTAGSRTSCSRCSPPCTPAGPTTWRRRPIGTWATT